MRLVTDRQGSVWACSEDSRLGSDEWLEEDAPPETTRTLVRCGSERGAVSLWLSTHWQLLSDQELVEQIERAQRGADEDADEDQI